jgi:hypothetical protein
MSFAPALRAILNWKRTWRPGSRLHGRYDKNDHCSVVSARSERLGHKGGFLHDQTPSPGPPPSLLTCCHAFRATALPAYLETGGTLEQAQTVANHESLPTLRFMAAREQLSAE